MCLLRHHLSIARHRIEEWGNEDATSLTTAIQSKEDQRQWHWSLVAILWPLFFVSYMTVGKIKSSRSHIKAIKGIVKKEAYTCSALRSTQIAKSLMHLCPALCIPGEVVPEISLTLCKDMFITRIVFLFSQERISISVDQCY